MKSAIASILVSACSFAAQAADGLQWSADTAWPTWQARLSVHTPTSVFGNGASRSTSAWLLGDYYFGVPRLLPLTPQGGLRATGGLVSPHGVSIPYGLAAASQTSDGPDSLPYFGLGYSRSMLARGLSFSADVGLVAQNPGGASRFGRALTGNANLDDAVRNLRLAPLVQLGVRYSF
jgi:hypothetical protein